MTTFIDTLAQGSDYDPTKVVGYSDNELQQIERLYDVSLMGKFRGFLSEMGRSDGGLIGDDPITLYRTAWDVRTQILHQVGFFGEMQDAGQFDFLRRQPFTFACESETQYFFLRTSSDNPERVYHYDENEQTVKDTGLSFLEYMMQTVQVWGEKNTVVCRGELLIV